MHNFPLPSLFSLDRFREKRENIRMKIPKFLEKWWKPVEDKVEEVVVIETTPTEITPTEPLSRVEQRLAQLQQQRAEKLRGANEQGGGSG